MYDRMNRLVTALSTGLYERDEAIRLGLLASLAGESMFLLGPPGVGKSLIARRLQMVFGGAKSFSYLMGRFSTPDEVFGPLSIRKLKHEDRYERVTTDYLPDADVVFLDEIWKASPPIQNALLTALNERLYRNGSQEIDLPLKVFIGASNELPEEDETAAAFWDRFLIRLVLDPVTSGDSFRELVNDTTDVYRDVVPAGYKLAQDEFRAFQADLARVTIPDAVMGLLLDIRRRLTDDAVGRELPDTGSGGTQGEGTSGAPGNARRTWYVSDRRWKKIARLLRASALLQGSLEVTPLDCAIIRHCIWNTLGERAPAERIVRAALASHAGHPDLLASFRQRAGSLEESIRQHTVEIVEEDSRVPVLHRDEYYRLIRAGAVANGAVAVTRDEAHGNEGEDTVLAWHGDIDELALHGAGTMDIFRYDENGQLLGSEEVSVERIAEWTLRLDGSEWEIQTSTRTVSRSRTRTFSPKERSTMAARAEQVVSDAREEIDRLLAEQAALEDQAHQHLFVPAEYARLVTAAVESAAAELTRIRIIAAEILDRIHSGP